MSRRAQDAPAFRALAGQLWASDGVTVRVQSVPGDGVPFCFVEHDADYDCDYVDVAKVSDRRHAYPSDWTLDESDPATMGTVEHLVREAWAPGRVTLRPYADGWSIDVYRWNSLVWSGWEARQHEALAAALHAAPTEESC